MRTRELIGPMYLKEAVKMFNIIEEPAEILMLLVDAYGNEVN